MKFLRKSDPLTLRICKNGSFSHNYSIKALHAYRNCNFNTIIIYAAVIGHLELTLLKVRERFNAISTSNFEVYKFRDWWILTYFIFGLGECSPNDIWSTVNLERTSFCRFLCLKVNLDLEKTNQLGESSPNFIFLHLNLDLEKKNKSAWWIFTQLYFRGGESWPNYFGKEVNWWWILI